MYIYIFCFFYSFYKIYVLIIITNELAVYSGDFLIEKKRISQIINN